MTSLTPKQLKDYNDHGYVAPIDILTAGEANEIKEEIEKIEKRWPNELDGLGRNYVHMISPVFDKVCHNSKILDAVESIIGKNILVGGTTLFIKDPDNKGFVSWHQDAKYMGLEPHVGITAWIALSKSDNESGCMQMIPGSHSSIRDHNDTFGERNILTRGQEVEGIDETKAVSTPLRPGQASFHSARVVHSSQPNKSNDRRIGFVIQPLMPPSVIQTKSRVAAQLVRGKDEFGHFDKASRPTEDMNPNEVAFRDNINNIWKEHLYEGAEKTRDL